MSFEKASYSLPKWLDTTVLFVPVEKRSNSRSDVYKIYSLKNLPYSQENTCVGDSLKQALLKRDSNTGAFRKTFYIEPQPVFTCSKLTLETPEQVVKYVQTLQ